MYLINDLGERVELDNRFDIDIIKGLLNKKDNAGIDNYLEDVLSGGESIESEEQDIEEQDVEGQEPFIAEDGVVVSEDDIYLKPKDVDRSLGIDRLDALVERHKNAIQGVGSVISITPSAGIDAQNEDKTEDVAQNEDKTEDVAQSNNGYNSFGYKYDEETKTKSRIRPDGTLDWQEIEKPDGTFEINKYDESGSLISNENVSVEAETATSANAVDNNKNNTNTVVNKKSTNNQKAKTSNTPTSKNTSAIKENDDNNSVRQKVGGVSGKGEYNDKGIMQQTDSQGRVHTYTKNADGGRTETYKQGVNVYTKQYDSKGNLLDVQVVKLNNSTIPDVSNPTNILNIKPSSTSTASSDGVKPNKSNVGGVSGKGEYNDKGVMQQIDSQGRVHTYTKNADGGRTETYSREGAFGKEEVVTKIYDSKGNLVPNAKGAGAKIYIER